VHAFSPPPVDRVKRLFNRIRPQAAGAAVTHPGGAASGFFTSMFDERDDPTNVRMGWNERAAKLDAQTLDRHEGLRLLEPLLAVDPPAVALTRDEQEVMLQSFVFASVVSGREVIAQDERGDYLMMVLDGLVAVDRVQLWGDRVNLGEARMGDVLGEMSLLDAGPRFSSCTTLKDSRLAILEAASVDRLFKDHPRVALALVTMLARRMSLRLRYVSTRLTALLVRR
jgi:CRP/FNR family transcriptional regulator, cyclic AMP receptor protein